MEVPCLLGDPTAKVFQEKLDALLRQIFGEIDPFNKRYPLIKEWNYNKPCKK
jgi:hypothetical protein